MSLRYATERGGGTGGASWRVEREGVIAGMRKETPTSGFDASGAGGSSAVNAFQIPPPDGSPAQRRASTTMIQCAWVLDAFA